VKRILVSLLSAAALRAQPPADADIRAILVDRIDTLRRNVGIAIGIVDANGRRFVNYGTFGVKDARSVTSETIFEIGSITKVFTSLALADMVERGEVALDDPVANYLPAGVKVPERGGKKITLLDLATHSSGLPRLPTNMAPKDPSNPYADYTTGRLFEFLSGYTLTRDIGEKYEYSNLGAGLLGTALARRAGTDYPTLLRTRITGPLKMSSTAIALDAALKTRLAAGHDEQRQPAANWDLDALAGAGAIRSDAADMLSFVAANLGYVASPLSRALAAMTKVRRPGPAANVEVALAWHITHRDGRDIVWHNGGTGGYRSFIGFDPQARVGVVALSNMSTTTGVDDIGMHLLDSAAPLAKLTPLKERQQITLDPAVLDGYTGVYEFLPTATLTISREGPRMFAQLTGQPRFEIFAESEHDFFLKAVDAQLTFEKDAVLLHQNGRDQRAKRK
jgi:CubicO group peptidase (beta-lactamase class C family)